ncbi:hypothetical protein EV215_0793 [Hypnocyclicus thermotrophus]|uniref:Lipoprotein n=1 Tax=Hypnocyclicus thermotrophus TaxID=1627895 RepID=A0AA46DZ11_9FUSO|nr:hypothetical protein [Hypnocyclicus thermotrophus]TDT71420.1 hypothetical protein EV215_0793 [Hypnocyclicus thermotrophus]
MKKILLFITFLILTISCSNTQKSFKTKIDEKVKTTENLDIIDLGIKEVKKSENSYWYDNFSAFRESYKKFKINSDLFLGIGGIYLTQEKALESAKKNGEENIKNSLSVSGLTKENFGNIIDTVLEVHNVKYKGEEVLGYKYTILLEVNKVSAVQKVEERTKLIQESKKALTEKEKKALEYENKGDISLKEKNYLKAIINYKNAKAIYAEIENDEQEKKIDEKIALVNQIKLKEKEEYEKEQLEYKKQINKLELLTNPNKFDLIRLKDLYLKTRQIKQAEEIEKKIQDIIEKEEVLIKKNEIRNYIKSFTKDGYYESNYIVYFDNYKKYFDDNILNKKLLKSEIEKEILEDNLAIVFPKSISNTKNLDIFIDELSYKYNKSPSAYESDDRINDYSIYKYKTWNIIKVENLKIITEKGRYGYKALFSVRYTYFDFKNNTKKEVNIPLTRSIYTDYTTEEQAILEVIKNLLSKY